MRLPLRGSVCTRGTAIGQRANLALLSLPRTDAADYGVLENSTLTERGLLPPLEPNRIDLGQVD